MLPEKDIALERSPSYIESEAINFGGEDHLPPPPRLTEAEEKKLWRKIDLKLLPILTLLYLLSFIDRGEVFNYVD